MQDRPQWTEADIEAAVRAYLARMARRYAPILLGALALLLVIVTVPTVSGTGGGQQSVSSAPLTGGQGGGVAYDGQAPTGGAPAPASGTQGAAPGSAPAGGTGPRTGSSQATSSGTAPSGTQAQTASGSGGISRSGVKCGPGVRQVAWSVYAPPCVPKFTGNNGGATSHGVTPKTITLSFRLGQSQEDAAVTAASGSAAPAPDRVFVQDMQTYISYFNTQFELYGRKVVLKTFQGQGDYIQEDQGQGADKAAADAATARSMGAFGDATFYLKGSNPYWSALAQQHVVAWGPLGFPDSYYEKHAPYWWSYNPSGSDFAWWLSDLVCQRMAGMKAIFAPDATLAAQTRKFGLIHPENPEYIAVANEMKDKFSKCGVKITREASYSINVVQYQQEAASIVAQMQSAGVTTVLCYCDPLVPIFLQNAAQAQHYQPEWVQPYWGDPQARQPSNGNWQGLISAGGQWPAKAKTEAYRVFTTASGGAEPKEQYYEVAYLTLMQIFMGLQAAGPDLTPQTLQRGYFSLPDSGNGDTGIWRFRGGANAYAPAWNAQVGGSVGWYDPTYTSAFDGAKGGYRDCDGGQRYPYDEPAKWGGPRQQLHCFGR